MLRELFGANARLAYAEVLRESHWAQGYGLRDVAEQAQALSPALREDQRVREFIEPRRRGRSPRGLKVGAPAGEGSPGRRVNP